MWRMRIKLLTTWHCIRSRRSKSCSKSGNEAALALEYSFGCMATVNALRQKDVSSIRGFA